MFYLRKKKEAVKPQSILKFVSSLIIFFNTSFHYRPCLKYEKLRPPENSEGLNIERSVKGIKDKNLHNNVDFCYGGICTKQTIKRVTSENSGTVIISPRKDRRIG